MFRISNDVGGVGVGPCKTSLALSSATLTVHGHARMRRRWSGQTGAFRCRSARRSSEAPCSWASTSLLGLMNRPFRSLLLPPAPAAPPRTIDRFYELGRRTGQHHVAPNLALHYALAGRAGTDDGVGSSTRAAAEDA